jgi:phosphatidylglycerophosphatase A
MNWKIFVGSTFFSSYLFRRAPGTSSSLLVFLLFYIFNPVGVFWSICILIVLSSLHFICYPAFAAKNNSHDPTFYTLDEALAMVLLNIFFNTPGFWFAAFVLFRFFDIVKPLGIKNIENLPGLPHSLQNIGDDLVAAAYTFLLITMYEFFY